MSPGINNGTSPRKVTTTTITTMQNHHFHQYSLNHHHHNHNRHHHHHLSPTPSFTITTTNFRTDALPLAESSQCIRLLLCWFVLTHAGVYGCQYGEERLNVLMATWRFGWIMIPPNTASKQTTSVFPIRDLFPGLTGRNQQ